MLRRMAANVTAVAVTGSFVLAGISAPAVADDDEAESSAPPQIDPVVFNDPKEDPAAITDHIKGLIRDTPEGATIQMAMYKIEDEGVVKEFEEAAKRGVKVQVISDYDKGTEGSSSFEDLKRAIEDYGPDGSDAKLCNESIKASNKVRACIGNNVEGIEKSRMHSKFLLFSETRGSPDVVVLPTQNLTGPETEGGTGGWNSAYTEVGNSALYKRFDEYFDALDEYSEKEPKHKDVNYYESNPPMNTGNIRSYFFPREVNEGQNNDTISRAVGEGVDCDGESTIRVNQYSLSRGAVAEALRSKSLQGCSVEIVVNRLFEDACHTLLRPIPIPLPWPEEITVSVLDPNSDDHGVHAKNLMIDGTYMGDNRKITFTGTHNFNLNSLRGNDENMVRIASENVHDAFVENFYDVYRHRKTTHRQPSPEYRDTCEDLSTGQ